MVAQCLQLPDVGLDHIGGIDRRCKLLIEQQTPTRKQGVSATILNRHTLDGEILRWSVWRHLAIQTPKHLDPKGHEPHLACDEQKHKRTAVEGQLGEVRAGLVPSQLGPEFRFNQNAVLSAVSMSHQM